MTGFTKTGSGNEPAPRAITQRRRLGATRHEALMLAMQGKHAEAASVLLAALGTPPEDYEQLGDDERRLVTMAATYLQKAGDFAGAARLFDALGDTERSSLLDLAPYSPPTAASDNERSTPGEADGMGGEGAPKNTLPSLDLDDIPESTVQARPSERLGSQDSARDVVVEARALVSSGKADAAGELLAEAGYCYEAGICFLKAGNSEAGLAQLCLVAPGTPHYPAAARTVIRLAGRMGFCDAELYRFLSPFLIGGPTDFKELELFRRISELLEECGLIAAATSVLEVTYARFPDDRLVTDRLLKLRMGARPSDSLLGDEESAAVSVQLLEPVQPPVTRRGAAQCPAGSPRSWAGETGFSTAPRLAGSPVAPSLARAALTPSAEQSPSILASAPHTGEQDGIRISAIPAPGAAVEDWHPGMVIGGRFRLNALIGRGGMAEVFSATDLELEEEVALKVFSGQLVTDDYLQEAVHRFRQELKLCRKLNHGNIIQVYDIGIHAGHRYFTMELLRGQSLGEILGVPLDLDFGLHVLIQACAGLHAAHERGVVHRDVKPDNIFVTSNGLVKIMDFGIAKSSIKSGQTTFGTIAGTPEYMSPEQINDFSGAGPAADQYSLGIVAYEMFTGQIPFAHEHMVVLLTMHLESKPTPPREINPAIPEPLERIIMKMLSKKPAERFESCQSVQATMMALLSSSA